MENTAMTTDHVRDGDAAGKAAHTPGPWRVKIGPRDTPVEADIEICGDIFILAHITGPQYDHCHANARLVGACPTMLAALERADAMIDRMCTQALACGVAGTSDWDEIAGGADMFGVHDDIKDAIAKARGYE
jgi:hypothetical protein